MNEMIERVAKALWELDQKETVRHYNSNPILFGKEFYGKAVPWEYLLNPEIVSYIADEYRKKAKAAIDAMREPTEEMINAGIRNGVDNGFGCGYNDYLELYKIMIDKALE